MNIEIKKLTPELVDDFFRFFEHIAFPDHPEWGCGCYCCFFMLSWQELYISKRDLNKLKRPYVINMI